MQRRCTLRCLRLFFAFFGFIAFSAGVLLALSLGGMQHVNSRDLVAAALVVHVVDVKVANLAVHLVDDLAAGSVFGGEVTAGLLDLRVQRLRVHAVAVVELNGDAVSLAGKPARRNLVADAAVANGGTLHILAMWRGRERERENGWMQKRHSQPMILSGIKRVRTSKPTRA